jgi:hypothetical protein
MAVDLAARLSVGKKMPDGSPGLRAPANTLFLAAEDGVADTILPRFLAAGGDPKRVALLESIQTETGRRPPNLVADLHRIEEHIRRLGAQLLVIDPLLAFLVGAESKSPQDMAEVLAGLKDVLERTGCACLALRHLSKGGPAKALYRGLMSVQILAAARSALYFERHPDDDDLVVLAVSKGNLAPRDQRTSLAYKIVSTAVMREDDGLLVDAPRIEWQDGEVDLTADDLARGAEDQEASPRVSACMEVIATILETGPIPATRAWELVKADGFSERIAKKAKAKLGIKSIRRGFTDEWWWATPAQAKELGRDPK